MLVLLIEQIWLDSLVQCLCANILPYFLYVRLQQSKRVARIFVLHKFAQRWNTRTKHTDSVNLPLAFYQCTVTLSRACSSPIKRLWEVNSLLWCILLPIGASRKIKLTQSMRWFHEIFACEFNVLVLDEKKILTIFWFSYQFFFVNYSFLALFSKDFLYFFFE